ncbi:MAG: HIT family protein [Candidatus Krumholzibacteria bacterium]|nr:HIT family protein [Candidatus Krumholzibacteria bacterium]
MNTPCPFCDPDKIIVENDLAFAIYDRYPVSHGHILVIPRRHFSDIFEATPDELRALSELTRRVREFVEEEYAPDGYNIGINRGRAAGQSIMHVHIHFIPRYSGDRRDPKGGVRGVIPKKQKYP